MRPSSLLRLAGIFLIALIAVNAASAFAAANSVPSTRLDDDTLPITANNLKPSECAGINLTNIIVNGNGTAGNDLILGTAGGNTINGEGGADCIVGGDGNDRLSGSGGADVILGGGGNDRLNGNQGNDTLFGGSGNDRLWGDLGTDVCDGGSGKDTGDATCETEINIP